MRLYHVSANGTGGYHEAETEAAAADAFARSQGFAGAGALIEGTNSPITVEDAAAARTEALLKIEAAVSGSVVAQIALLARSVQDLGEAVTDMGEILATAAAGRTSKPNGSGR